MTAPADVGVLRVDKPPGPTSHDIVARARRALGIRRIGHTGTLDPFASGLLLLCIGRATRLAEYLTGLDKRYRATALLGQSTDTDDLEGEVVRVSEDWRGLEGEAIEAALAGFVGRIDQIPPRYSAKKVAGERMYRRARRGQKVDLAPVQVDIFDVRLESVDLPQLTFAVHCSSGTYVRALTRDLGEALGVGAHLTALRRTSIGSLSVEGAVSGDELHDAALVRAAWLSPARALDHMPVARVDQYQATRIAHGQAIDALDLSVDEGRPVAVLHDGDLICVASRAGDRLRPRKVLA